MDLNKFLQELPDLFAEFMQMGPTTLLGVDVGLSAVKMCELSQAKNGEFKLQRFVKIVLPEGALIDDEIQREDDIVQAIVEAYKRAKSDTKKICIGLSGPHTIAKRLPIAAMTTEEVEDQVYWESEQYIPFGLDSSSLSFHVLGQNLGGGTDVIVAAARNDVIEAYSNLVLKAGLKLKVIDLSVIALSNVFDLCFKREMQGYDKPILILDFGAQKTHLMIYKKDALVFSKELPFGGGMFTEEIQRQMGLNFSEAEDLKIVGDANGNLPEEIVEIIGTVLESFFGELKKSLSFYLGQGAEEHIEKCYLTGGSSLIPGLASGLQGMFGVEVNFFRPFDYIAYNPKDFSEEDVAYISSCGVVALGLAMRKP